MGITFSFLSIIFTLLGLSIFLSMANDGNLLEILTFGTKGILALVIFNLYPLLGLLFAFLAEKNNYRAILFVCSISILLISLIFSFIGLYGFQEP